MSKPNTTNKRKRINQDPNPDKLIDPIMDIPTARLADVLHDLKRHTFGEHKGVNISIEASDTFAFDSPEKMTEAIEGIIGPDDGTYVYSRSFNPTVEELGRYVAAMEGTESAYCTSSGMSAITAVIMHLCKNGGHVVAAEATYAGSHYLLKTFLPEKCNILTSFVDISDLTKVDEAMTKGKTSVLYFDTVANPALIVADIPQLCRIAHAKGVQVVVDNTFTPMILTPAKFGADVVVHSLTKYVSGTSDIIAGAICGSKQLIKDITNFEGASLMMLGPVMNPTQAFELLGRMAHMGLRLKKHCNRALKLAQRMKDEFGIKVNYPGLIDHPGHELLDSMRNKGYGFGAIVCIDLGTTEKAYRLLSALSKNKFGFLAVSLGYYENLLSCPGAVKSKDDPMSPGYIRMSIGYNGTLALKWDQFKKAYEEAELGIN